MITKSFLPALSDAGAATAFVEQTMLAEGCPDRIVAKLCIITDELFANIAQYSGAFTAQICCGIRNGAAELIFSDDGTAYDPTAVREPDITLDAEKREIGGLGIHMVRRFAASLSYARRDGRNELTVRVDMPKADGSTP